jgi:hypothetical protein
VTAVEEAAAKAHVDEAALGPARADLGVVTSREHGHGPMLHDTTRRRIRRHHAGGTL